MVNQELFKAFEHAGKKVYSAREVHEFLGVKTRFNDWIANRINDYGFVENEDYVKVTKILVTSGGKQEGFEYAITPSMGKELSMVEKNDQGKKARLYFIEQERIVKNNLINVTSLSRKELALLVIKSEEENEALQAEIQRVEPMKQAYYQLIDSEGEYELGEVAKVFKTGQKKFFNWMRNQGIIMKEKAIPYQKYVNNGWFRVVFKTKNGFSFSQAIVTPKGMSEIRALYFNLTDSQHRLTACS
jgi:anti-repressor protein